PRSYNLRLGNNCNLKCVMCRPDFSSKWKGDFAKLMALNEGIPQSARQHLEFPGRGESGDHRWYEDSRVFEVLKENLSDTQQYYFSGGEPMMTNLHRDLIQLCVESGHSQHIHLMYDTNGLFINEEWLRLWEQFASVDVHLSIDGIGKKYEYIRYPARWEDLTKVAAMLSQWNAPNATVRILVTQQLLNVLDGVEILRWYIDTIGTRAGVRYQIVWNLVEWPECLTSQLASEAIGEKAKQKLLEFAGELRNQWKNRQEDFVKSPQAFLLKDLDRRLSYALNRSGGNGESLKDFIQYLNALDQVRGTQWVEVFPELAEMIRAEL
ncbi:MAG: radical SAM protein, partial [Bdellovibrionales bacterium]|nr:radical SAM protein [Bdellovibrionales bacterium]